MFFVLFPVFWKYPLQHWRKDTGRHGNARKVDQGGHDRRSDHIVTTNATWVGPISNAVASESSCMNMNMHM